MLYLIPLVHEAGKRTFFFLNLLWLSCYNLSQSNILQLGQIRQCWIKLKRKKQKWGVLIYLTKISLKIRVMLVQVKLPPLASITRASQGPGAEEGRWDAGAGYFCVGMCSAIKCCLYGWEYDCAFTNNPVWPCWLKVIKSRSWRMVLTEDIPQFAEKSVQVPSNHWFFLNIFFSQFM